MQQEETRYEEDLPEGNHKTKKNTSNNDTDKNGVVDKQADWLADGDKDIEQFLQIQIEAMDHYLLLKLELREKLSKVKLT